MISFLRAHKGVSVIIFSWVVFCAFVLIPSWREGPFAFVFFSTLFVTMIASQLFWIPRVIGLGERFILGKPQRIWLKVIVGVPYLFFFASNFGPWYIPRGDSTHLTLRGVLLDGAWSVWLVGWWVGFALVMVFWTVDRAGRAAAWVYRKAREAAAGPAAASMPGGIPLDPASPARRPAAEGEVVHALAGLRASYGVVGCLGNHEFYAEAEDSITRLFVAAGIRILRQERASIQSHGEVLNLIGLDYEQRRFSRDHDGHLVDRYLEGSEKLVMPDMVNILLSHNPNSFDRAAESGIDLTLAGHSHGGQLALSFINRGLTLVRPETRYVNGWYEKPGGQLYVNRGIGTTGPPIRLGARPEITVLELSRK